MMGTSLEERPAARPQPTRGEIAREFCRFLEARAVVYALIGDPRALESEPLGDVDLMVDPDWGMRLPGLVREFCDAQRLRLVHILRHEWSAFSFVVAWRGEAQLEVQFLYLDLYVCYVRRGRDWLRAQEFLERRRASGCREGAPALFVPPPEIAFLAYLLKKVEKRTLEPRHAAFLQSQWLQDPPACREQLRRFWSLGSVELLARGMADDPQSIRAALPQLARELRRTSPRSLRSLLFDLARRAQRTRRPVGYWIALLGPDGAGKSALADRIGLSLGPAFRAISLHHLRPHVFGGPGSDLPVIDPHGRPPRGRLASALKLLLWWLDGTLGFAARILPRLIRSALVIFDRHPLDLVVDPLRYRYGGSVRVAEWILMRLPRPGLFVVLDAPVPVLHQRKREVRAEEAARQRQAYRALAARLPDALVVDASREPDQVCAEVVERVLEKLVQRTALRAGLPPPPRGWPAGSR